MKNKRLSILVMVAIGALCVVVFHGIRLQNPSSLDLHEVFVMIPMTGAAGAGGNAIKRAMDAYFNIYTNVPFSLHFIDSETDPLKSVANLTQVLSMNNKKPIVVVATTTTTAAVMPVIHQFGGFAFPIVTMDTDNIKRISGYQRVSCGLSDTVGPVASYAKGHHRRVSIFHSNDDLGCMVKNEFSKIFTEGTDCHIVQTLAYDPKSNNARDIVSAFKGNACDAVYVVGSVSPMYSNIFSEIRKGNFRGEILTDITFSNEFIYKSLGNDAEGVVFACIDAQFDQPHTDEGRFFRRQCLLAGIVPYYVSMEAFDVLNLITKITKDNQDFNERSCYNANYFGVLNNFNVLSNGGCHYQYVLAKIENGLIVHHE